MFIIIGQSLPSRLVTQKLTLQKSQIIIVAIMKHMEEDFTPEIFKQRIKASGGNWISKYKQFTQKYTKLLSTYKSYYNHTFLPWLMVYFI